MGQFGFSSFEPLEPGNYSRLQIVNDETKSVTERSSGKQLQITEITFAAQTLSKTKPEPVSFVIGVSPTLSPSSNLGKIVSALLGIKSSDIDAQFADRFYLSQLYGIMWKGATVTVEVAPASKKERNSIAMAKPAKEYAEYVEQLALYLLGKVKKVPTMVGAQQTPTASKPAEPAELSEDDEDLADPFGDD